ncbi:MAG: aromatic amino acid lyase [Deltaproteobacteria bacterium]|nr:MAG: aromatic amino acid lyase [Deltaproteobacteria bacterium]
MIEQLIAFLNHGIHPIVSEKGSVGASGDLVPLAQIALALMGEGRVRVHGKEMCAAEALREAHLKPVKLQAKEGLALINGTQFTTAITLLNWDQSRQLLNMSHVMTALAVEAERGTTTAFRAEIHEARRHGGQGLSAQILMKLLTEDGSPSAIGRSHTDCKKVQDPYHLRCAPQVLGAVLTTLSQQGNILFDEINAVTDNPIVTEAGIFSGGNFHAQPIATAADSIAISLATAVNLHQAQIAALLTNTKMTELPAFLVAHPERAGIESGMMMLDVAAAALAAEARTLAAPASVHSLPTAGGTEDHVSMGPAAARKMGNMVSLLQDTLALGLIVSAQGINLVRRTGDGLKTTHYLETVLKRIRQGAPFMDGDRSMTDDITFVAALLASGQLTDPFIKHLTPPPLHTMRSIAEGTLG